jgi:hypothetical protein
MAHSDKNIVITPNVGSTTADPRIVFSGANASLGPQNITVSVYPTENGTLSFEGSAGQLFSITNSLSGTIFSVNDVSGIPSIEVLDTGLVKFAQYSGNVLIGTGTDNGTNKLQVAGTISATGTVTAPTFSGALSGNATTATTLQTARTIGGVSFNGSANINLPGVNAAGNQNTTGNAASATTVTTTASTTNSNFKIPMLNTTGVAGGNFGLLLDSAAAGDFTYNPSTTSMTVGCIQGICTSTFSVINAVTAASTGYGPGITCPKYASCHASCLPYANAAAPRLLPASPGLGIIQMLSKNPPRLRLAKQFSATPPMYTRLRLHL